MTQRSKCSALAPLLLVSAACTIGPRYQRPSAPVPSAYKEPPPEGWKQAQPSDGVIRGKWWEIYNDPELNALEEQINISNQNVLAAEGQFRQAAAAVRVARSELFPTVAVAPSITASRTPSNFVSGGQAVTSTAGPHGFYLLPFALSYDPDFWGRVRHSINAGTATAQSLAAALESVRLLYQTELASDYFQLHGIDGDMELLHTAVTSFEQYLQLTKDRYASGVASMGDVALAQTQLDTTRAQLVDLGVARAQFEHAIAMLTGKPPASLAIPRASIRALPPAVPLAVPSALLERRPDVAAAERQMAAANEEIGLAQTAYYPTLAITATAGSESSHVLQFLTWPSRFWSVGGQLSETLFDAGRRHAQVAQARAAYDTTVATYRQTVLTAFQQVEDSLAALRVLEQEAAVEAAAVRAARQSLEIATNQYKGGIVSYLQVITTQNTALQDERAAVDILTRRMASSVALIQSLGGGWNSAQLPTYQDVLAMGK